MPVSPLVVEYIFRTDREEICARALCNRPRRSILNAARQNARGRCRYPPSLATGADRPPATGAAAFSDDAEKGEGVYTQRTSPRWENAVSRSPANRGGLGQSRRLASARCRAQATRPRTTRPHEAQRRKRAKSGRKAAGANAQARTASDAQVRTPAYAGILAPLPRVQKVWTAYAKTASTHSRENFSPCRAPK